MDLSTRQLRDAERTMIMMRWFASAFALVQVLTFYMPYPPGVREVGLGLAAATALGNLIFVWQVRRVETAQEVHRLAISSLAFDFVLVMAFVTVYTFDVNTAMFALIYLLPLEGAIRFRRRGALTVMAAATIVYILREGWGAYHYGHPFLPASISFRMGIGMLIAAVAGAIATRYAQEQGRAGELTRVRRTTEAKLAKSEEMLARAQRVAHLGSWDWNIKAGELSWSDEMYRLYGMEPGDPIDLTSFLDRVHPDDRGWMQERISKTQTDGSPFSFDHRVVLPDGEVRMLHAQGEARHDESGEVSSMFGTGLDVTAQRAVEEALANSSQRYEDAFQREREVAARLRELDQIKDEFVAMASHELRTPTTVITGFAETLQQRWDELDDEQCRAFVDLIARSSRDLERLVEDVLQASHIESGRFTFEQEPFDLGVVVRETVADMATASHRTIEVDGFDDTKMAIGDARRQRQVIANLVSNALKFSSGNTAVVVRCADDGDLWRVSVCDEGVGIADEDLPRLFGKFERLEPRAVDGEAMPRGSGLGLFISRKLVELQGGTMQVESEVGVGSTFSFTLPRA